MSNSEEIIHTLSLMKERKEDLRQRKISEEYGERVSEAIFDALMRQMKADGRIRDGEIGAVVPMEEDALAWHWVNDDSNEEFYDDMSGKKLDPILVRAARAEEISQGIRKYEVYRKVPISEAIRVTGKKPIGTRWVDVNKGDEVNPEYRSRLVAKEIKVSKREDLFAATPPLEAKKALFSLAVTKASASNVVIREEA